MSSKEPNQNDLDRQYRTMMVLWLAFLSTIGVYLFLSFVLPPHEGTAGKLLPIVFSAASAFLVVVSFAVKQTFLSRSVDLQQPRLVTTGLILAAAFCEAAAILGLIDLLVVGDPYYLILILLALAGLLLHYPRRSHLESASFGKQSGLN
ncbi:MAG: hypothetical protein ABR501_00760 [Pyrinomonadaceae bacterium]